MENNKITVKDIETIQKSIDEIHLYKRKKYLAMDTWFFELMKIIVKPMPETNFIQVVALPFGGIPIKITNDVGNELGWEIRYEENSNE